MCIVAGLVDQRTVEIQRIQGDAAIERRVKRGQDCAEQDSSKEAEQPIWQNLGNKHRISRIRVVHQAVAEEAESKQAANCNKERVDQFEETA